MTDEYKQRIIEYLTGNYTTESQSTTPLFIGDVEMNTLTADYSTYFSKIQGYIQGKDGKGNDLDLGFVYGYDANNKGVIAIVDDTFNIIEVITQYDSGTEFNKWICLNIDVTNGNIYGLDEQGNTTRFILLNNFLMKLPAQQNYQVKLRNSYNVSLYIDNVGRHPVYVEKNPSSSFYILIGSNFLFTYEIVVGGSNTLTGYKYTGNETITIGGYNIAWTGDDYVVKIGGSYLSSGLTHYIELGFETEDTEITKTQDIEIGPIVEPFYFLEARISNICMTNNDTYIGFIAHNYRFNRNDGVGILKVDYTNNDVELIYSLEVASQSLTWYVFAINLFKKGNQIYLYGSRNLNSPSNPNNTVYEVVFGLIDNNNNILSKSSTGLSVYALLNTTTLFNVVQTYNLLKYNVIGSTTTSLSAQQIFNSLNYNCEDYQALNSMVPKSGILYDENDNVVFARNLYNKTIIGNTTTSVLEVPNTLLNDITISQQDLLGATNGIIVAETDDITKNIYEDLFINFINTLTIQNQNTETYITNLLGASRLNASISNTLDYSNAQIGKIRINYTDNTSYVKSINQATKISQFVYKYTFIFYAVKPIKNIEIISNDETTVYQTIDGNNFVYGNKYKVSQNVEIQ